MVFPRYPPGIPAGTKAVQFSVETATADPPAAAEVIRRHQVEVWHYLRTLGCDPETADDLSQETFLVALRKQAEFASPAAARAYLRRTARFLFLEHRRKAGRRREVIGTDAWIEAVDASFALSEPHDHWLSALARCREALEGRRAQVVGLFYEQGLTRAEVAQRLSMTEHGVRNLLQRARAALRKCIEKETR